MRYWYRGLTVILSVLLASCAPTALLTASLNDPEPVAGQQIGSRAQVIFRSPDDLVLGNPRGKISIVEFFDYNCIYCKANVPQLAKLIEADADVRIVIKEYPILGPDSLFAARAALAAARQGKQREFHWRLAGLRTRANISSVLKVAKEVGLEVERLKRDMESPVIDQILESNKALAKELLVEGTPTFVIDDSIEPRFLSFEKLIEKVRSIREAGGCNLC